MDFHAEFERSIKKHRCLIGLIFADPEGESILYDGPIEDDFHLQLAGAKMPLLLAQNAGSLYDEPRMMEIQYQDHVVTSVVLEENYSITAISNNPVYRERIRTVLLDLAVKFNREIV